MILKGSTMFSKFDTTVAVCETPAHCPTAADLAEYREWCERQELEHYNSLIMAGTAESPA